MRSHHWIQWQNRLCCVYCGAVQTTGNRNAECSANPYDRVDRNGETVIYLRPIGWRRGRENIEEEEATWSSWNLERHRTAIRHAGEQKNDDAVPRLYSALVNDELADDAATALIAIGGLVVINAGESYLNRNDPILGRVLKILKTTPWKPKDANHRALAAIAGHLDATLADADAIEYALVSLVKREFSCGPRLLAEHNKHLQHAVSILAGFGYHSTRRLTPLLEVGSEEFRSLVARALGRIRDLRAIIPLRTLLATASPNVRRSTLLALADLDDSTAIEPLIRLLYANPNRCSERTEELRALRILIGELAYVIEASSGFETLYSNDCGIGWVTNSDRIATEKLCEVTSGAISHILHLACNKPNIKANIGNGGAETIEFNATREKARNELARRGNPPYRSDAFVALKIMRRLPCDEPPKPPSFLHQAIDAIARLYSG